MLRAHYRSPIEVTPETLADAEKALARLDGLARRFGVADLLAQTDAGYVVERDAAGDGVDPGALAAFRARMDDDLDTPGALAGIFELVTAAHSAADAGDEDEGGAPGQDRRACSPPRSGSRSGPRTSRSTRSRPGWWPSATRPGAARDFARADALRDELVALGWTVEDTPSGTAIRR